MRILRFLQLTAATLALLFVASCGKDDEGPNIRVGFSYMPENPVAGQPVTFTNASTGGTTYEWDFGDGNNSTERSPQHTYEVPDTYMVRLVIDGKSNLSYSEQITVTSPAPTITYSPTTVAVGATVVFTGNIYNPTGLPVTFTWDFGSTGWESEDLNESGIGTGASVAVRFTDPSAAFQVRLTASIGGQELQTTVNVQVSLVLAKTLWVGVRNGNLSTIKLLPGGGAELVDTGIEAGAHPLTVLYSNTNNRVYVFDAGPQITFTATPVIPSTGSIKSYDFGGNDPKTHLTFETHPFNNPFFGSITDDGAQILFTDRRNDVSVIPESTLNAVFATDGDDPDINPENFPSFVRNNRIPYWHQNTSKIDGYNGARIEFGHINGSVKKRGNVYWWAKNSNGSGIYRFLESDISPFDITADSDPLPIPSSGAILRGYGVRAFEIDEENQKIYFSSNNIEANRGFYRCNLDGSNIELIDNSPLDGQGGTTEGTFITGVAIDNEAGYVYWAYRGPTNANVEENPLHRSGVKRWKLDGSGSVEYLLVGVQAYGIAIDHTKR
jgi:hypothetical protein